ncbi:hypothetical protein MRB53_008266 [Persea americana]|uniref:Uncharacterized protein n=1 Tax=Persea americana TaxID=3435 RepID=A0ACC2MLX8_PERAE|nr:hypothetical protein MRB53_008266 [Persea americana]
MEKGLKEKLLEWGREEEESLGKKIWSETKRLCDFHDILHVRRDGYQPSVYRPYQRYRARGLRSRPYRALEIRERHLGTFCNRYFYSEN